MGRTEPEKGRLAGRVVEEANLFFNAKREYIGNMLQISPATVFQYLTDVSCM